MRVAFISDIHSNVQALEAVMAKVDALEVDMIACAGDVIGYNANPRECCQLVQKTVTHAVIGNHDYAVMNKDTDGMNKVNAEPAALWTIGQLPEECLDYLKTLGLESRFAADGVRIAMFHGSPRAGSINGKPRTIVEYVGEKNARYHCGIEIGEILVQKADCDILILGHTHRPFIQRLDSGLVVNPGSVGQPRDGNPRASFAIIDTETMNADIIRIPYDIDAAASAIRRSGLQPRAAESLAGRLYRGW